MTGGGVSRRELLAGIGMAGAAIGSGAVGHSTASAFLADTEQFAGNVLTAGEVDLAVEYDAYYDSATDDSDGHTTGASGRVDGDSIDPLVVEEIKPGDSGRIAFCPGIAGNPAYLWLCGAVTKSLENGKPDPEGEEGPMQGENPPDGEGGEVEDAIEARLAYVPSTDEGAPSSEPLLEGTLAQVLGVLQYGLPLNSDPNDGASSLREFAGPGEQACFEGTDGPCIELEWWMPGDVNNNIVSDQLEFEFRFHAQQCRHNDGRQNPCAVEKGISFAAFCADSKPSGARVTAITERNGDGEPLEIEWASDDQVDTVVLYYGTVFENFYVDGATSGTVRVGQGDVRLPKDVAAEKYGQSPSDPCPDGESGVKYKYDGGEFTLDS